MAKTPSHEKIELELSEAVELEDKTVISMQERTEAAPGALTGVFAEKYLVLEKLGEGGISTVYRVKHLHLNKVYALKILQQVKPESTLRFQQEAKAVTLLRHPNIVGVVDFGVSDGRPYMVMECVEGQSLSSYVKNEKPDSVELARICSEICLALAHSHERGVVHRDIKPGNILVSRGEDNIDHPIVLDFGIAKITGDEEEDAESKRSKSQLTRTGDIFGTPLYMSPEQCQGQKVDARSDVYSFGCVMYELVNGKPPFEGDSPYQIIHKHICQAPPPFQSTTERAGQSKQLESIILKAMAKQASDRFQYMLEMSSALKAVELGSTQTNQLFLYVKLALSRLKASDRKAVFLSVALRVSILLALFASFLIYFLPAKIAESETRLSTQNEIIERTKVLFDMEQSGRDSIFRLRKSDEEKRLSQLRFLCQNDKELDKACGMLNSKALYAVRCLYDLKRVKKGLESGDILINKLSALRKVEFLLSATVNEFSKANQEAVALIRLTSGKLEREKSALSIMQAAYYSSLAAVLPLFAVILITFALRRKQNES